MNVHQNPFHSGEIEAQRRAGVGDVASQIAGFIRPYIPDQHRQFYQTLPFIILSGADSQGRPWVTLLEGEDGFIHSPDNKSLILKSEADPQDPLSDAFVSGTDVGLLGIQLETRRRNRLSGFLQRSDDYYTIDVRQTFGNCPQYIRERSWHRQEDNVPGEATLSETLNDDQIGRIRTADTMFIGTGQRDQDDNPSNGYDASHRGGEPGFVQVVDEGHLRIPDYSGNNFFNSIGNILKNPRVGLVFIDFEKGDLLHITGQAEIDWAPTNAHDKSARRMIDVTIEAVVDRPSALSLRWDAEGQSVRHLSLIRKVEESNSITSFYFVTADARPLATFKPGQHLPIALNLAPPYGKVQRSYSLSAAPNGKTYRLSIKREDQGLMSRIMHDVLKPGHEIEARDPSGDFLLPDGNSPLVLVSAGVGITPMMAMLHHLASDHMQRPTWFVHGARNGQEHALKKETDQLINPHPHVQKKIFYSQPDPEDLINIDYDVTGRITTEDLLTLDAGSDAHYLLCGPSGFVASLQAGFENAGVNSERIHFETF